MYSHSLRLPNGGRGGTDSRLCKVSSECVDSEYVQAVSCEYDGGVTISHLERRNGFWYGGCSRFPHQPTMNIPRFYFNESSFTIVLLITYNKFQMLPRNLPAACNTLPGPINTFAEQMHSIMILACE